MDSRKPILRYLALLPLSFVGFAVLWAIVAPTCLYHCWDDGLAWWPPFIHPWGDSLDGKLRDYYIVPGWLVHGIWLLFIAGALIVPAFLARRRER